MHHAYYYKTQIGPIGVVENGAAITHLFFGTTISKGITIRETSLLKEASQQLQEYLSGQRKSFELPIAPQGTEFQQMVWKVLQEIPYGETCSYKEIAERISNPKAFRAVGLANNRNPIPIFIPCHRVIGSNGSLVGYVGGLEVKKTLLAMEKQNA
jgi:O-6-methylguanine DNA methyltransferase